MPAERPKQARQSSAGLVRVPPISRPTVPAKWGSATCDINTLNNCTDREKKWLETVEREMGDDIGRLDDELQRIKGKHASEHRDFLKEWIRARTQMLFALGTRARE